MRPLRTVSAIALLAGLAGCSHDHPEGATSAGISYLCADGKPLRVVYHSGDPRGRAQLLYDGNRYEMTAAPAISGLRYASETGLSDGQALVWTSDGIDGVLAEVPAAQAGVGEERELSRCTRLGWDGSAEAAAPTAEDEGAHDEAH